MKMELKPQSSGRQCPEDIPHLESHHCLSSPINLSFRIGLSIDLSKSILNSSHRWWRGNHHRSCCHTYWAWLLRWRCYVGQRSPCQEVRLWKWFPPPDRCRSSCPSRSSSRWNTWKQMFVNLYHSCCNKARGFSLWARGHELGLIEVVIVLITHFEWSFAENVLRMAFAFQSRNGARALWPCWARTFLGRKWILGTVGTISISSRAKKKKKECCFGVWGQRQRGDLWGMHLRPYPVNLKANPPVTSSLIRPCDFILKGYFSLIILWFLVQCPSEKYLLLLLISLGGGQGLGEGLAPCSQALPPNRCLISHGLAFGHGQFLRATVLFSC